jgi:hypothetical protein
VTDPGNTRGARAHNAWWFHNPNTGQRRYLFVGQEGPGQLGASSSGDIHVLDVSNLAAPVEVASYRMSGTALPAGTHNFWMDEAAEILYAAYYNGGVVALDVSGTLQGDLASRELARIHPGGDSTYVWGVQLHAGSVYATDMLSGLFQPGSREPRSRSRRRRRPHLGPLRLGPLGPRRLCIHRHLGLAGERRQRGQCLAAGRQWASRRPG